MANRVEADERASERVMRVYIIIIILIIAIVIVLWLWISSLRRAHHQVAAIVNMKQPPRQQQGARKSPSLIN